MDAPGRVPHLETTAVHTGVDKDGHFLSVTTPIYPSSTFRFPSMHEKPRFDYTRCGNPTRRALEESITALEGAADTWCTATGMAAITAVLHLLQKGDHVVAGHDIYGGTYRAFVSVFAKFGITFTFVDQSDLAAVERAVRPETRMVWIETPSNPLLNVVDIAGLAAIAHRHGALAVADNTFLSPALQKPIALGTDLVVHSTTKYLNGHSDVVGGAVVVATKELSERVYFLVNALGLANSPFDAWLVLRGIKTLPQRMAAHERGTAALARALRAHGLVKRVYWPGFEDHPGHALAKRQQAGFGGMVTFDVDPLRVDLDRLFAGLRLFALAESLGGVESLIEVPWCMSHASMPEDARRAAGISEGTIRVSVGIEHPDDLVADLCCALDAARR
jgi:cystathionine beta-lyase/cystathionine gamma-synthase